MLLRKCPGALDELLLKVKVNHAASGTGIRFIQRKLASIAESLHYLPTSSVRDFAKRGDLVLNPLPISADADVKPLPAS